MRAQQQESQGVIMRLYGFGPAFGLADGSPFVLKVEAFCRWQGLAYDKVNAVSAIRRSPSGKLPMLVQGEQCVVDSHAILDHLTQSLGLSIDQDLSDAQRAESYFVARSVEEHLYFLLLWVRWWPDQTWPQVRDAFFAGVPAVLRGPISAMVRRQVKKQAWAQGVARYPDAHIVSMLNEALQSLAIGLDDRSYWFGDDVHRLDIELYAFLAPMLLGTFKSPYLEHLAPPSSLVAYVQRLHERLAWPS